MTLHRCARQRKRTRGKTDRGLLFIVRNFAMFLGLYPQSCTIREEIPPVEKLSTRLYTGRNVLRSLPFASSVFSAA